MTYSGKALAILSSFCLLFLLSSIVHAAKKSEMSQDQVCVADRGRMLVNPKHTMRWLMSENLVRPTCLDYDDDGDPVHLDRVLALIDDDYAELTPGRCKGGDLPNLIKAQDFMVKFFQTLASPEGYSNYKMTTPLTLSVKTNLVYPNELYNKDTPDFGVIQVTDELVPVYEFFVSDPNSGGIICIKEEEKAKEKTVSPFAGKLIVRGKVEDLKKPLSKKTTKKISATTFSVVSNEEADTTEYNISGVVGYRLDALSQRWPNLSIDFIPYVGVERRFATGKKSQEVDNLRIGVNAATSLRTGANSAHTFDLHPQLTVDSDADTKIGSLNMIWQPAFLIGKTVFPNIGIEKEFGTIVPTFAGKLNGGVVFDDGGNNALEDDEGFLRMGANVGAKVFPRSGTILDQFVPFLTYEYVFGAAGKLNNADRLEAGFNFVMPDAENFQVGIKYVTGQADETFEDVEFIEATVGVKF